MTPTRPLDATKMTRMLILAIVLAGGGCNYCYPSVNECDARCEKIGSFLAHYKCDSAATVCECAPREAKPEGGPHHG